MSRHLAALAASLAAGVLFAADPPFLSKSSDTVLVLHVTAAIQAEPVLRDLALVIDVRDGVAVIGGEVPRQETADLVKAVVSTVPGLKGTRIECRLPLAEQSFLSRVRARLDSPVLTLPWNRTPPPTPIPQPTPAHDRPPPLPEKVVTAQKTADDRRPPHVIAAEALRNGDPRFARLTLDFDDGVVVVGGAAESHADAVRLMLHLRLVPGVERVRRGSIAAAD